MQTHAVADILGVKIQSTAGEDTVRILPILGGKAAKPVLEAIVHHSINGSFVIRQGNWKLAICRDSGGWSDPRPGSANVGALPEVQLYDLASDIGEQTNLQDKHPEIVARPTKLLERYAADGRSTPGPNQTNTVPVDIWKTAKTKPKAAAKKGV